MQAVAQDPEWLLSTLASVEEQDEFTARVMALQREVLFDRAHVQGPCPRLKAASP